MARIYKKVIPFQGFQQHLYQTIGDNPMTDDKGNFAGYPTANMSVAVRNPEETPNFDFNKQPEPVDESDNRGILQKIRNAHKSIKNETGLDVHTASSPYLQNAVDSATNHHIESVSTKVTRGSTPDQREGNDRFALSIKRKSGIEYAKNIRNIRNTTSELFHGTPQTAEVYSAFSHSKMRHMVPIMGALAHQEHGTLTAGGSLSTYSSKAVKNAQDKGLPIRSNVDNKKAETNNDYGFDDRQYTSHSGQPDFDSAIQYTPDQIRSAKMHYRQLRGYTSAKGTSPQFEQLQFPGMG